MASVTILILLTALFYIRLNKILFNHFVKIKENFDNIKDSHDKLEEVVKKWANDNKVLQDKLEETIALYDLTKKICISLDGEKVFNNFREQIDKHIMLNDCKFLKADANLGLYEHYEIFPLLMDGACVGYLAADGIREEQKDKFHILAHQFMLGIKRVILYQKVQELAITDTLTGTFTRRYYMERFNEEIIRSKKFNLKFSFLMVDIDHFKDFNDRYGHLVGDAILREVSKTIKENIRQIDSVGRYGGEEFIIILTETDKNGARFAAERIRQSMEARRIKVYDEELKVTISIGISTHPEDAQELPSLIEKADRALYRAKQSGRNRVCVHGVYR